MAELVDALDSKSGYRKVVQVRFLFRAPKRQVKPQALQGFEVFLFAFETDLGRFSNNKRKTD